MVTCKTTIDTTRRDGKPYGERIINYRRVEQLVACKFHRLEVTGSSPVPASILLLVR